MTNREYLNTLSNEEFVKVYAELGCTQGNCHAVDCDCKKCRVIWLQAEHTTTADEDFAEIGFFLLDEDSLPYIRYGEQQKYHKESNARIVNVCEERNQYITKGCLAFDDELIDQIRTIADKKRKEMGWGK